MSAAGWSTNTGTMCPFDGTVFGTIANLEAHLGEHDGPQ